MNKDKMIVETLKNIDRFVIQLLMFGMWGIVLYNIEFVYELKLFYDVMVEKPLRTNYLI